jgi:signal recognition particle receptor subunit beta
MVLFNHATREMTAKIVYYGPGLCGKTTNLLVIFDKLDPKQKGKMLSLATKTDRTLFFDLLPVDAGKVGNFNLKFQLYTVPGQVFYNETRKLVLRGADSVVFVCDSQPTMVESNRESFANLMDNLKENKLDPNDVPIIIQFNKRDLPGVLPVEVLQEKLGFEGYPYAEAAAIKGTGVMETFKLASKVTAKHLLARLKGGKAEPVKDDKKKPAKGKEKTAPAPIEEPTPEPLSEPAMNPFADSVPFPESAPLGEGYEKMEEISLEQLLEGRERPETFSGTIPVPLNFDDAVEDVPEDSIVDGPGVAVAEPPVATAVGKKSVASLEADVKRLEAQLSSLRKKHREALDELIKGLSELTEKVRRRLQE